MELWTGLGRRNVLRRAGEPMGIRTSGPGSGPWFLLLLCSILPTRIHCQGSDRTVVVPLNSNLGQTVINLETLDLDINQGRTVVDLSGDFAHYFVYDEEDNAIKTAKSMSSLRNQRILTLDVVFSIPNEQGSSGSLKTRVVPLFVRILPEDEIVHFVEGVVNVTLDPKAAKDDRPCGSERISAVVDGDPRASLRYYFVSGNEDGLFHLKRMVSDDGRVSALLITNDTALTGLERRLVLGVQVVGSPGNGAFLPLTVQLNPCKNSQEPGRRWKRDLRPDVVLRLPEDYPLGLLPRRLHLSSRERVKQAPVAKEHVRVLENGSLVLTSALNFEKQNPVELVVMVENRQSLTGSWNWRSRLYGVLNGQGR